jgi:hypothetical protein
MFKLAFKWATDQISHLWYVPIKFCVKMDKIASEMLALLTLSISEYTVRKLFLNGISSSRKAKKMFK